MLAGSQALFHLLWKMSVRETYQTAEAVRQHTAKKHPPQQARSVMAGNRPGLIFANIRVGFAGFSLANTGYSRLANDAELRG